MDNKWLTSLNPKRHQRAMNKLVRNLNRNIENDTLWKGRFCTNQIRSSWREYEDKSGGELWVVIEFVDKKTGITKQTADSVNHWRSWNGFKLWQEMNNFIVEDIDVWRSKR